jgi:hypothetical protein
LCTLKEAETTGIADVNVKRELASSGAYTLDGRQVRAGNLRPGLYIINGRKVVVK